MRGAQTAATEGTTLTRFRVLVLAVVAVLAAGLAAGCGGSGGDEDPQQVLDETFNQDHNVTSGVLDLSLSGSAEGQQSGSVDASLKGPFQQGKSGELPELDLTGSVKVEGDGQSFDFSGGLTLTSDAAFITYKDHSYEVPAELVTAFKQGYDQAQRQADKGGKKNVGGLLDQYGIEPQNWLTNISNEGDTDVEGTQTIHIHGDADVPKLVQDLQSVAQHAGGADAQPLSDKDVQQVEDAVDEASIDVYSGKDDRILRKLDVHLKLTSPDNSNSSVDSVDVTFSVTLSGVNEDQSIQAPSNPGTFQDFESALGLPPGVLEGMLGGSSLGGGGALGGGGSSGGVQPGSGSSDQKYLNCISKAKTAEDLQACQP